MTSSTQLHPRKLLPQEEDIDVISMQDLHIDDKHREEGIRLLLRQPGHGRHFDVISNSNSERYLTLSEPKRSPKSSDAVTSVVAITQAAEDINVLLRSTDGKTCCDLYYDPLEDDLILRNASRTPFEVLNLLDTHPANLTNPRLDPQRSRVIRPGTWTVSHNGSRLELRVLARLRPQTTLEGLSRTEEKGKPTLNRLKRSCPSSQGTLSQEEIVSQKGEIYHTKNEAAVDYVDSSTSNKPRLDLGALGPSAASASPLFLDDRATMTFPGVLKLERYRITKHREIASLTLSKVFLGHHSSLGGPIVIKVVRSRGLVEGETVVKAINHADCWLREYRNQKRLQHKSIVQLKGGDARYLTLYMEYIPAFDLSKAGVWCDVNHQFLGSKDDAFRIWLDIAKASDHMHANGIIHHDIKPANILYCKERGAVLCDFGLSVDTGKCVHGGTPYYIPPEYMFSGLRECPSDIWAFGITMLYVLGHIGLPDSRGDPRVRELPYWLIADVRPIKSSTRSPIGREKFRGWLKDISNVRRQLSERDDPKCILRRMLAPHSRQRPTAAEIVELLESEDLNKAELPSMTRIPTDTTGFPFQDVGSGAYGSTTEEDTQYTLVLDESPQTP
ncbi:MAG: hypothetical protein M1817_002536 [Caeruleum heppii]|nr:MAG: hypothetical protein M1817_002536 [Caeruleum heppii]